MPFWVKYSFLCFVVKYFLLCLLVKSRKRIIRFARKKKIKKKKTSLCSFREKTFLLCFLVKSREQKKLPAWKKKMKKKKILWATHNIDCDAETNLYRDILLHMGELVAREFLLFKVFWIKCASESNIPFVLRSQVFLFVLASQI